MNFLKMPKEDDTRANKEYLREYYLKDYKYISPEILEINRRNDVKVKLELERKEGFIKLWCQALIQGLKQFLYEGSLHGVKYIFEPSFSRKERITWIIIMLFSLAICAVNIIQLFSKWTSTPFVNVIDSLPTPIWAVPFPTVVLCPQLHLQLSYANVSELVGLEQFFASLLCPHQDAEEIALDHRLTSDEYSLLENFIIEGSPKCTDIVKMCYWRATNDVNWVAEECCEKLFKPTFTNYGLCFAFNSLPLNAMSNETLAWQRSFNPRAMPESLEWHLDKGYPKVFPPDPTMVPFRVMASGEMYGLGVELYLNISEHQFACDGSSLGFNLLIGSPMDHVYTSTVLRLPMEKMTAIEVSPITYKTDAALGSLDPLKRQCYFQNEKQLEYYEFYTDSNCQHDLLVRIARKECDCVLYNWPRKYLWEPICSTASDFRCIVGVESKVEEMLIYAYYAEGDEQFPPLADTRSCHPSCNDILYSSQVFYSDLSKPIGGIDAPMPEWGNPKQGEVTRINIHFYDDIFLGQHRHAQYDDYYFVGAIGGLLSLFLGFSIISVAELVYFVIMRPLHIALKETYFNNIL